jgi:mRNA interferase HigB
MGTIAIFERDLMRIIARNTLIKFWNNYPEAEQPLKSWYDEVLNAIWKSPNELKKQYSNASVITNKRVVFNIKGNSYRLIADIEYRIGIVFIVWVGTHKMYDKVNVKEIKYVKTD